MEISLNVLVWMSLSASQRQKLEQAGAGCHFFYMEEFPHPESLVPEADVIIGNVPPEWIQGSPRLRLVQLRSAGTDGYTLPGILSPGTVLANATGAYDKTVAEHGLALTLSLQKKLHLYRRSQMSRIWQDEGMASSIADSTVLICGFGSIGATYAKMVKALGATVIGLKRRVADKPEVLDELYTTDALDEVLPRADVIFSVLPSTKETAYLFTSRRFEIMKPSAIFINCGRGNAVSSIVLYEALKSEQILAAACDVFEEEPLPPSSPLWTLDNLIITPHVAGGNHLPDTQDKIIEIAAHNLRAALGEGNYRSVVDLKTGYKS